MKNSSLFPARRIALLASFFAAALVFSVLVRLQHSPLLSAQAMNSANSCPQLYNQIVSAWRKSCGQTGYNPVADIDKNKQVGTSDYALYSSNYKKIGWCQQQLSNTT
ncbi:MAG: hypothetical protein PHE68_00620, partial [Candidatus Peribacteraceae bacterium]|nr:hypothetical protein [Candidatus Peribacteraceae bacterium]MDD5075300.1 hypothetical protein [Candidatus Peribacteraceae bacterium]